MNLEDPINRYSMLNQHLSLTFEPIIVELAFHRRSDAFALIYDSGTCKSKLYSTHENVMEAERKRTHMQWKDGKTSFSWLLAATLQRRTCQP
jgi:hypothetical protein